MRLGTGCKQYREINQLQLFLRAFKKNFSSLINGKCSVGMLITSILDVLNFDLWKGRISNSLW